MDLTWDAARRGYAEAARWFLATTAEVGDRWDRPALGVWDVRALVGHTTRALLTVEQYLADPAPAAVLHSPGAYLRATSAMAAGPGVADRGRAAGADLGADPLAAATAVVDRVLPLVAAQDGTALLTTVGGGMRLSDYLPTRTFELVVHTCDLARALGLPADPPAEPAAQALAVVTEAAALGGSAGPLLLAATGRAPLPEGFSVL